MPAARSPCRAMAAPPPIPPGRNFPTFSSGVPARRRCAGTPNLSTSTGQPTAAGTGLSCACSTLRIPSSTGFRRTATQSSGSGNIALMQSGPLPAAAPASASSAMTVQDGGRSRTRPAAGFGLAGPQTRRAVPSSPRRLGSATISGGSPNGRLSTPSSPRCRSTGRNDRWRTSFGCTRPPRRNRLELMIRLTGAERREGAAADLIGRIHESGVRPDWWMVGPQRTVSGWKAVRSSVEMHDRHSRGIILDAVSLEGDAIAEEVGRAGGNLRGMACGHRALGDAAGRWLSGNIDDATLVRSISVGLNDLCDGLEAPLARSGSPK